MSTTENITIQDAVAEDADFADLVIRNVMTVYVEQTWTTPEEREAYFASNCFDISRTQIIRLDGKDIGTVVIRRLEQSIDVDQIFYCPNIKIAD